MKKYILYAIKNILYIRKNHLNIKLDRNTAKNYIIETKMFDNKDINSNNRKKNIEDKNKKNINLFITDTYSFIIIIMHIC